MESQGGSATGYTTTTHPELHSANPNMAGGAHEKKGIADKVKGLLGGHGHKTDAAHQQTAPVYGDATAATGTAESTRVGCLDKLKAKTGVGHGLAPEQTRAHGGGHTGHTGGGYTDPSASPDFNGGMNLHSSAAVHGGWPQPTNPKQTAGVGAYSEPHHNHATHNHPTGLPNPNAAAGGYGGTNPTGVTNPQGGAVLGDHQGNVYEGPRDDNVKKEGFVSKIMDKLHSPANANQTAGVGAYSEPQHDHATHNHPTGLPSPNATGSGYGGPQPTNPTGVTNPQGGAVLGDHHGNVYEGPRDDGVKKEGFVSKIMDKLHSPKGKPVHPTTTTTPSPY